MKKNLSATTPISSDDHLKQALERLAEIIFDNQTSFQNIIDPQLSPLAAELEQTLLELRQFILELANGDLSRNLKARGGLADALKALQANLRHLTWQTQQVANGDFSQRVEFLGDFATAFNHMVAQLDEMGRELERQQDELIRRNDSLIYEVAERERAEAAEREQRQLAENLQAIAMALNATLDFESVLDIMLEKIGDIVPYDSAVIMLVENMTATTRRAKNYHLYGKEIEQKVKQARFEIDKTPNLYTMLTTMQPLVIPDVDLYPGWNRKVTGNPVRSWIGVPVMAHGRVIAFFSLDKLEPGFYNDEHARKLSLFASHAALALENARLFQEIQRLAVLDGLTGLYNRRYFFERACAEFERACRYHHPISMIMMDLDHFKLVNDSYGHQAGDMVLQQVSKLTRQALRQSDLAGRYGGEEFIFLLPETGLNVAVQIAERLRQLIANASIAYNGKLILVHASFGVSGGQADTCNLPPQRAVEEILSACDEALYQSKQAGRNKVSFQDPRLIVK